MAIVPREYQGAAVASIWQYFREHTGNPVVAMPTGTGKSVVIALFLIEIFRQFPTQRVLALTHVKELIEQNFNKIKEAWPNAPAGINSSGLKRRDTRHPIIFAGVASIVKQLDEIGVIHLLLIDEAHLVSPHEETMYQAIIRVLLARNPMLKVIGFTATPWRLGQGKLIDDGIFTDVCFDMTSVAAFNYLIAEGFLSPLIPKQTQIVLDVSGVHKSGGEFKANELQAAVNKDEVTYAALQETIAQASDRSCWLVFASGVDHAETITAMLNHLGVNSRVVHSKMGDTTRDANIADWKAGKFTAIVNNGILTTGVDNPILDLIVMLRPTASTVLWVQMLGRGTRPVYTPGFDLTTTTGRLASIEAGPKRNCLVLDFAGNTKRLGPINDPVIPRKKGEGTGEAPIRICEVCGMYNHASARYCGGKPHPSAEGCGAEFAISVKISDKASTNDLIKTDHPVVEVFKVDTVTYAVHNKVGKPPSLRVSYYCGLQKFNEYLHFEMPGFLQRKARNWWTARGDPNSIPTSTLAAATLAPGLRVANRVRVWTNKPYPEIMAVSLDPDEEFN